MTIVPKIILITNVPIQFFFPLFTYATAKKKPKSDTLKSTYLMEC